MVGDGSVGNLPTMVRVYSGRSATRKMQQDMRKMALQGWDAINISHGGSIKAGFFRRVPASITVVYQASGRAPLTEEGLKHLRDKDKFTPQEAEAAWQEAVEYYKRTGRLPTT